LLLPAQVRDLLLLLTGLRFESVDLAALRHPDLERKGEGEHDRRERDREDGCARGERRPSASTRRRRRRRSARQRCA
jgi:hypothetical protein